MSIPRPQIPRAEDARAISLWRNLVLKNIVGLRASFTWNPGSLADGEGETSAAITVTGAEFGDFVQVAAPYDLSGCLVAGYVSAANTIRVRLQNETGGAVDLASGTWIVRVNS